MECLGTQSVLEDKKIYSRESSIRGYQAINTVCLINTQLVMEMRMSNLMCNKLEDVGLRIK